MAGHQLALDDGSAGNIYRLPGGYFYRTRLVHTRTIIDGIGIGRIGPAGFYRVGQELEVMKNISVYFYGELAGLG